MKKIIILLSLILVASTSVMEAQKTKKNKKNKKAATEKVDQQKNPQLDAPTLQAQPVETKPINSSNLDQKPSLETQKPTNPENLKPLNYEQILQQSKPIIQEKPNGQINWTEQYIEAKGVSVIDKERYKNPAQAKLMAQRGSVVDAQRNLLEIIKGVNVTSETTVQDMITTRDYIYTRIDGIIKGAQMVGEPVEKDGYIEVKMRVPLYENNGLAAAIYNDIPQLKKTNGISEVVNQIPDEIKDQALEALAFNMNGQKFDPSLFPIIVDENNNLVLDLSKLYDPTKGKFPKILNTTEELLKELGYKKGVEFLNVIKAEQGKLVIDNKSLKKVNWQKIGQIAGKVGKFLMMLI